MDIKQVIKRLEIAVHQKKMVKIKYVNYYNIQTERYIKEIKFSKRYFDINKKQCIDSQFNHIEAFCILKNQIRIFKINRIQFITDGKDDFPGVKIGNQIWMTENLNVSEFRNGESIKELSRNSSDESGFYSYPQKKEGFINTEFRNTNMKSDLFSNINKMLNSQKEKQLEKLTNDNNEKKYGKLYNWSAVNDSRGLAPIGWHIPTRDEWNALINFLKNNNSRIMEHQTENNYNSNNHCGFDAKLSGIMNEFRLENINHGISGCELNCCWWSASLFFLDNRKSNSDISRRADAIKMFGSNEKMFHFIAETWCGMSVRCIKDK